MEGLKEWATVVKALEQGKQTVILRKGGILETASGFNIESKKFFLFPTWEHQETKHVKPEFHDFLNEVLDKKQKEGFNKINDRKPRVVASRFRSLWRFVYKNGMAFSRYL